MKSADRARKFRDMSADELERQEAEMSEQIFKLRFQWAMGQTESLKKIRELRKDRARLLTILHEKESEK
ncbi:MAG: 50S ribosomal protein L29 [Acidobacteria bacterium 13_1_20CM_2_55_15]|nr:MAG: 50S ribosomal protein L29 [Acidobacteria bacterium 13_1_40CM_56_16]OLD16221.1 MAG: 50S ribosomal protein L29 [Acidobacteria bacterium 13_1_40CM_3_56_11]OLE88471.1 MAG: 50S ribosomal protein L29 [Acidobacteria bacterium 13_1_20CM_2_55_15]